MFGIVGNDNLQAVFPLVWRNFCTVGPLTGGNGVLHVLIYFRGNGLDNLFDAHFLNLNDDLCRIRTLMPILVKELAV